MRQPHLTALTAVVQEARQQQVWIVGTGPPERRHNVEGVPPIPNRHRIE